MSQPPDHAEPQPRFVRAVRIALAAIEESLYVIVGVLLLGAAVLVVVGTVSGLISSIRAHQSAVDIGVVLLDRVLLTLIVAELLHTLPLTVQRGEIVVEALLVRRSNSCGAADSHHHGGARGPGARGPHPHQRAT
jgi:hypothetical protein